MDIDNLTKALNNENNSIFMNLSSKKVADMKKKILSELELSSKKQNKLLKSLEEYMYVDEMLHLKMGSFIRWISISVENMDSFDPEQDLFLTTGAMLCEIKMCDSGVKLCLKNHAHRHFQINLDENLIFQKLTKQEQVLLFALDHLYD